MKVKNKTSIISYSQCWEDPILLEEALDINSTDRVLSITSGGDNSLALLSMSPAHLVAIDVHEGQKYTLDLKLAAIQYLSYTEMLELIGVKKSDRRKHLFERVKGKMSEQAVLWWGNHKDALEIGVINAGRFEKFMNLFSRYVLPCIHSNTTITKFLQTHTIEEQQQFYESVWNSKRWRLLFKVVTNKFILKHFARQKGMFTHTSISEVGNIYLERLEKNLKHVPISENYFMHYSLMGCYAQCLPMYLEENRVSLIKKNADKLTAVVSNIIDYLKAMPDNSFSKFNLSDVFEPLSVEQNNMLWQEIVRTAKSGARVAYWNNLVPRSFPTHLSNNIKDESVLAQKLHAKDRVYFYGSFHVHTILK